MQFVPVEVSNIQYKRFAELVHWDYAEYSTAHNINKAFHTEHAPYRYSLRRGGISLKQDVVH